MGKTIIYCTSNMEQEKFERNVQETLLKAIGDLPLISVSQKPISFGKNICVGEIGATAENTLLQLREGALEATTPFIARAEADCLYHESYFKFTPEEHDTFYYPDKVYLLWVGGSRSRKFWPKQRREISSIVGRKHLINTIDKILLNMPKHISKVVRKLSKQEVFQQEIPVVDIKTRNGMHWASTYSSNYETKLPFWGTGPELLRKYL